MRATRTRCGARSRCPRAPTPPSRWRGCCTSGASARRSPLANATGSFAAEGLASRLEDDPELAEAFAALDAGELQRGLDALIEAIRAPTRTAATSCAARSWACSTSSAPSTRWRASRAASWPRAFSADETPSAWRALVLV